MTDSFSTNTVNLPGGVRQTTTTRLVSSVLVPWIRSRKVYFKAQGLLPNMRHKPYFDGRDVSAWCREEPFKNISSQTTIEEVGDPSVLEGHPEEASNLISDANGVIEGSFYIPNTPSMRFRAGRREFKLLDWKATSDTNAISKSYASYTAQGTLDNFQTTVTTIRPPIPPPPPPPPRVPIRRIDPIAQSFLVDNPSGMFVTTVELYFATKSTSVPVQVQIRPVDNGYPTNAPVPGAIKMLLPSEVGVTSAPVGTNGIKFRFDEPVFLEGGREYAIVILAETDDYTVWSAVTTEFIVGSQQRIMKQPSMGSFFKSQNGSTWTADQTRDMMFKLYRASFGADSTGTAFFESQGTQARALEQIEVLDGTSTPLIRCYLKNHGLFPNSSVTVSKSGTLRGLAASALNKSHTVVSVAPDSFVIEVSGTPTSTGLASTTAVTTVNNLFDLAFFGLSSLTLPGTQLDWSVRSTSGQSHAGAESPYVKASSYEAFQPGENILFDSPRVVASKENETSSMGGSSSLTVKADLMTEDDYISPLIDLSRFSAFLIGNRVDRPADSETLGYNVPASFVAETDPLNGSAIAKHIFNTITLAEPAIGLKVLFAGNRGQDSEISLYYRTLGSGSGEVLQNLNWIKAETEESIPFDTDGTFREYTYQIDDLEDFSSFQLKIVMTSKSTASPPRVKDFRAIALIT